MGQLMLADWPSGQGRIANLPHTTFTWTKARNTPDTVQTAIPMVSRAVRKLDLRNATTLGKSLLAVIENDVVVAAGIIHGRKLSDDGKSLSLTATGDWFNRRTVLPALTDDQNVIDPATGDTAAWAATDYVGYSYGQMVKMLAQQAMTWPGGTIPLVFQDDELGGTFEEHYKGANLTNLQSAIYAFTNRMNGVDVDFLARRTSDRRGIELLLRTGILTSPEIHGASVARWDFSVKRPSVRGLEIDEDDTTLVDQQWATGGRQDGTAVVARSRNAAMLAAGYPLIESVDSSHADASEAGTLQQYADNGMVLGSAPSSALLFQAKAQSNPQVGSYLPGDYADLVFGREHVWMPFGITRRELGSLSGDQDSNWITIKTEEQISA